LQNLDLFIERLQDRYGSAGRGRATGGEHLGLAQVFTA
jgi:hypothetical protein